MMDRMDESTLESLRTRIRKPRLTDITPQQEAERKIYRDGNGKIGFPALMLFACLREAGRYIKFDGKRQISTSEETILPALLTIEEEFLPFLNGNSWVIDRRRAVNHQDNSAVCVVRPRFDKWEFEVTIDINEKMVSEDTVRQLFDLAGKMKGLGAFRKKGPFGRFKVVEWTPVK